MDMMPIFMIITLDIIIIMRFSINCSTVICLPAICFIQERSLEWNLWLPVLFSIIYFQIYKPKNTLLQFIYIYFSLLFHLSFIPIYIRSHSCPWPWRDWQSLFRVLCKCLLICAGAFIGDLCVPPTGLIHWFLTEGNTYLYFAASPFPLQRKKPTQAQEVALPCGQLVATL